MTSRTLTSGRSAGVLTEPADLDELPRIEARPADEGAVDVGLRHDAGDVPRLHRSSVQDTDDLRHLVSVALGEPGPDGPAHLLSVLRRGDLPGADRPDRLVRHHDRLRLLGRDPGQRAVELLERVLDVAALLADRQAVAHAQDRGEPVAERGLELGVAERVVLVVVLPALGVTHQGEGAPELGE